MFWVVAPSPNRFPAALGRSKSLTVNVSNPTGAGICPLHTAAEQFTTTGAPGAPDCGVTATDADCVDAEM